MIDKRITLITHEGEELHPYMTSQNGQVSKNISFSLSKNGKKRTEKIEEVLEHLIVP